MEARLPCIRRLEKFAAILFLSFAWAGTASAGDPLPAAQLAPAVKPPVAQNKTAINSKSTDWNKLTPAQRSALAPLASDWNTFDSFRKKKWLELADRYATMSEADQQRMQKRMQEWVSLSPEQRRIARENYTRVKKLHSKQKSEQWEQYQQLPEEKKKELAAKAPTKRSVAKPPRQPRVKQPEPVVPAAAPVAEAPPPTMPVQSSPSTPLTCSDACM